MTDAQDLVRKGIEAAREGNKAAARDFFERAVEIDDRDERAWFWLASVAETDDERRICLRNVLHINPNNERAQRALEKLEQKETELSGGDEVLPGISRRTLVLLVGSGVAVIALIAIIFLFLSIQQQRAENRIAQETQIALAVATRESGETATAVIRATETAVAFVSPTPTDFIPVRTLPPTFTPTPTVEQASDELQAVAPPPTGLTGLIAGWSGRDIIRAGYLPVGVYDAASGAFTVASENLGRDVTFYPDGTRLAYTRFERNLSSEFIEAVNVSGTVPEEIAARWRGFAVAREPAEPDLLPDGSFMTFSAFPGDEIARHVMELNMAELPPGADPQQVPSPLRRITNDAATYAHPVYSPDCTRIAALRDDVEGAEPGVDLVVIDRNTGAITPITNDRDATIETLPDWSPDGTQLVYAAASASDPDNHEIFIKQADGTGTAVLVIELRSPADDTSPVFSPDGQHIAFASNRNGEYQLFIFDRTTRALFQLTNTREMDHPTDWWQPGMANTCSPVESSAVAADDPGS